MSKYQLNIAYFYSIPIGNIQILVSNMYVLLYENLQLYLRLGLKLKNIYLVLEFNQPRWSKQYIEFNTKKIIEAEKRDKDGKAFLQINEQRCIRKKNGKLESYFNA